jgi:hypothetical protein
MNNPRVGCTGRAADSAIGAMAGSRHQEQFQAILSIDERTDIHD